MKIDLGCGLKKLEGFVGIDIGDFEELYPQKEFIKSDVFEYISKLDGNTVEEIFSNQFVEHIPKEKFIGFMNQCYRVLIKEGIFRCIFPPAINHDGMPNGEFYADPTHVNAILPGTFACFSKEFRDEVYLKDKTDYRGYGIGTDFKPIKANFINKSQVDITLKK